MKLGYIQQTGIGRGLLVLRTGLLAFLISTGTLSAQVRPHPFPDLRDDRSSAQLWMETLLYCMSRDGAGGPTIHGRNMYHLSMAMYDAWAVFEPGAPTVFLGKTHGDFTCPFDPAIAWPSDNVDSLREIAISHAAFRLIHFRFNQTATKGRVLNQVEDLFDELGYNRFFGDTDYQGGSPEALGNYLGEQLIAFGLQDGANEGDNYEGIRYGPVNRALRPDLPGAGSLRFPDRWQPLSVREYVNSRGGDPSLEGWNLILINWEDLFLTPHWGRVVPFALGDSLVPKRTGGRDEDLPVWLDPGPPPAWEETASSLEPGTYPWNFLTVAFWSAQLDPSDGEMIDISPGALGNFRPEVSLKLSYDDFYDWKGGGVKALKGHRRNPATRKRYATNRVPKGDYTRVVAEYWVDGINTVTPPGHWMLTLIDATNHPEFERRWMGKGAALDTLEWDLRAYLTLAGALHDAGIACWSIKAHYDYIRPISAIRFMAGLGQRSDTSLDDYHPLGLPLIPGYIEHIEKGDSLAGRAAEHVGKLKIYTWRGPEYVPDAQNTAAGVGWIRVENWWPYQRYSFGTPPFAGYVSGHSTYSTCAAEVLTRITGDPFFPGGIKEYVAPRDSFLVFEDGPSVDIRLQWATYHDAANETCLSRIWGGIHPPVMILKEGGSECGWPELPCGMSRLCLVRNRRTLQGTPQQKSYFFARFLADPFAKT